MKIRKRTRKWTTKQGIQKSRTYYYAYNDGRWVAIDNPNQVGYSRTSVNLYTKKGKLTKAGKAYREEILADPTIDGDEKSYLLDRLEVYARERALEGKATSLSSWKSRIKDTQLERMIFNLGTSAEEIAEQTGYDIEEVLNPDNWDFKENIFKDFQFEFDYKEYYGYKFTRRA